MPTLILKGDQHPPIDLRRIERISKSLAQQRKGAVQRHIPIDDAFGIAM